MQKVLLTRRRWDAYMILSLLVAGVIGIPAAWLTGQFSPVLMPVVFLPAWLWLRFSTPRAGIEIPTIRSTPGAIILLWFMAGTLISMVALFAIDVSIFGRSLRAPLEPYQAILYLPPFIIMFTGAFWADRIAKAHKLKTRSDDNHSGSNRLSNRRRDCWCL